MSTLFGPMDDSWGSRQSDWVLWGLCLVVDAILFWTLRPRKPLCDSSSSSASDLASS